MLSPFWPALMWRLHPVRPVPYDGKLRQIVSGDNSVNVPSEAQPLPVGNRIVIPTAGVDIEIKQGNSIDIIGSGGSWYKPLWTKSPLEDGNTVIIAHRFWYGHANSGFYHLDQVKVGDVLAIYWQGQELIYKVSEVKTVEPSDVSVEQNSPDRRLTLYTCTPVITAEHRLVVIAKPYDGGGL